MEAHSVPVTVDLDNDDFTDALVLRDVAGSSRANNDDATVERGEPALFGHAEASVWWTWIAPETGPFHFDTRASEFDTVLGVFTGRSIGQLTLVKADLDRGFGTASLVRFRAEAGMVYRIKVDGQSAGASGAIELRWGRGPGQGD